MERIWMKSWQKGIPTTLTFEHGRKPKFCSPSLRKNQRNNLNMFIAEPGILSRENDNILGLHKNVEINHKKI